MPVHFRTCSQCEAINEREAARCHKCGALLAPASPTAPVAGTSVLATHGDRPAAQAAALPLPSVILEPGGHPLDAARPPAAPRPARPAAVAPLLLTAAGAGYFGYVDPARLRDIVDSIAARW